MEREFVDWLRQRTPQRQSVQLGIGDDAAVLQLIGSDRIVVTTDMLMDGVDFEVASADPRRIGRKSLAVNLSDLAAMAARPVAAFVSVALPKKRGLELAKELYEGLLAIAAEFEISIAGGDTNSWDGPLVINVTAIGAVTERGPLLRSGARSGDSILVTGSFGGSILGRHFNFVPRVREALLLHERFELHAAIDVSDGLSLDLSRLAAESRCGVEVDLETIPVSSDALVLSTREQNSGSPLDHALGDGEDFELILAAPADDARRIVELQPLPVKITLIGKCVNEVGLWSRSSDGKRQALVPRGYEH